jgi:hypothetical protein
MPPIPSKSKSDWPGFLTTTFFIPLAYTYLTQLSQCTKLIGDIKKTSVLLCPGDETEVVTRRIATASRTYWLAGLRDGKGVLRWKTIPCEGKIEALEELDGLLKMKLGKFMRILAKL